MITLRAGLFFLLWDFPALRAGVARNNRLRPTDNTARGMCLLMLGHLRVEISHKVKDGRLRRHELKMNGR
jgi:hypothetical protein